MKGNRKATTIAAILAALLLFGSLRADTIDDAEAKARGVPVEVVQLEHERDQNAELQAKLTAAQAKVEALQAENANLKKQLGAPSSGGMQAAAPAATQPAKKVVLTPQQYRALPVYTHKSLPARGPIDYSDLGSWAGDGTPMGFGLIKVGAVGYLNNEKVVSVVDGSTAVVEVTPVDPGTDLPPADNGGANQTTDVLLEGISTKGMADNGWGNLKGWFKVVDTRKQDGPTYFVLEQVVQSGR